MKMKVLIKIIVKFLKIILHVQENYSNIKIVKFMDGIYI